MTVETPSWFVWNHISYPKCKKVVPRNTSNRKQSSPAGWTRVPVAPIATQAGDESKGPDREQPDE